MLALLSMGGECCVNYPLIAEEVVALSDRMNGPTADSPLASHAYEEVKRRPLYAVQYELGSGWGVDHG